MLIILCTDEITEIMIFMQIRMISYCDDCGDFDDFILIGNNWRFLP